MKNNSHWIITIGWLTLFSGCDKGELPVPAHEPGDVITASVNMGSDYRYQVFYDLETNSVVSRNLRTDWDLGFEASETGWHIVLNSARAGAAARAATTDFAAVTSHQNAAWAWDDQKGNLDSTAIGDWRNSSTVYIIDRGYDEAANHTGYRKITFEEVTETHYTFRYANLEGSGEKTLSIEKDPEVNFISFSFDKDEVVPIEPGKQEWDLLFTQYIHVFPGNVAYLVSGSLINRNKVQVAAESTMDFNEISYDDIAGYTFQDSINSIGYDWKYYDFDLATYIIRPELNYVIHTTAGRYVKLHFIDFYSSTGEKGVPVFEMQHL
ncbi:MAG: HmuY family protein [Bacteroidia bacterium]